MIRSKRWKPVGFGSYNNACRVLMKLPRFCSASESLRECFYATMRKRCNPLVRRFRGSTNSILKIIAGRLDCRFANSWMRDRWKASLEDALYGKRTIEAMRPVLGQWIRRKHGSLSFRLVQVMTGHGCFGHYLHRVARREPTPSCHECGAADDTAQHTLEECRRWDPQRHTLVAEIGGDLSLSSVVFAMLSSERSWEAVVDFCEEVIS
ncbi:jg4653, partial [Pararge aegeria aegeria]